VIDKKCFKKLKETYLPDDFSNLVAALMNMNALENKDILAIKRTDAYPIKAILALCGWRAIDR
jgi:hypothetical protein